MDHRTVERVARAIYDAMEADIDSVAVGRFDDGDYVFVDGHVDIMVCAAAAIKAYMEGAVEVSTLKLDRAAEKIAQLTKERDAAVADLREVCLLAEIPCAYCRETNIECGRWNYGSDFQCWEWRGVQT